jgi:hypothetical protein
MIHRTETDAVVSAIEEVDPPQRRTAQVKKG